MSFDSPQFLLFLGLAAVAYYLVPRNWKPAYLLIVSYLYYLTWSAAHGVLLLAATAAAYYAGSRIAAAQTESAKARSALTGVLVLLSNLIFFKYFFPLGVIGISYYTFKLVGYVLDTYWGKHPAEKSFVKLAGYAAFFPQVLSGPIARANDHLPQLGELSTPKGKILLAGVSLILFGLFKKFLVADQLAIFVDAAYGDPLSHAGWPLWLGVYGFSVQLYADFSGITDIAIGGALLFGISSPINFAQPFYAPSIPEFWKRWHITLTSWLTDYLFLPLRMAFRTRGNAGLALSILITMTTIGIWHGPRWNYLFFGLINGIYMVVSALTLRRRDKFFEGIGFIAPLRRIAAPLLTFTLLSLSFVFFRAETPAKALSLFGNLLSFGAPPALGFNALPVLLAILFMEALHAWQAYPAKLSVEAPKLASAIDLSQAGFLRQLAFFMKRRKEYFLVPLAVLLMLGGASLLGVMLFFKDANSMRPFIYTLF